MTCLGRLGEGHLHSCLLTLLAALTIHYPAILGCRFLKDPPVWVHLIVLKEGLVYEVREAVFRAFCG